MNQESHFALLLSDEMLIKTKNWDEKLKKYIGYFKDNIFRIRCSRFKLRNYQDPWECGFAPDNTTFTTTKWLKLVGNWGPCFSSDAFQQYISYYLFSSDPFKQQQYYRDIVAHDLEFEGDVAALQQDEETKYNRINGGIKSWFILNSYKMQKEAKRRSMLLKANIKNFENNHKYQITDDKPNSMIRIIDQDNIIESLSYSLPKLKITWRNFTRKFDYLGYCGGGLKNNNFLFNLTYYLSHKHKKLRHLNDKYNEYSGIIKDKGAIKGTIKIIRKL